MRTIKFRGLNERGDWIFGGYALLENKTYILPFGEFDPTENYEVDPETVGQYTNMKDRNGKEIYEGDILETRFHDGTHNGILDLEVSEVQFDISDDFDAGNWNQWFGWKLGEGSLLDHFEKSIVIGNVVEHKELTGI